MLIKLSNWCGISEHNKYNAVTLMDALQQLTVANDTSAKRMAIMKDAEMSTGINASMIPIVSS